MINTQIFQYEYIWYPCTTTDQPLYNFARYLQIYGGNIRKHITSPSGEYGSFFVCRLIFISPWNEDMKIYVAQSAYNGNVSKSYVCQSCRIDGTMRIIWIWDVGRYAMVMYIMVMPLLNIMALPWGQKIKKFTKCSDLDIFICPCLVWQLAHDLVQQHRSSWYSMASAPFRCRGWNFNDT